MKPNLAARAGRWSADQWKTALARWLVFCVAAVVIGGAVGTKTLKQAVTASGETRQAQRILDAAGFKTHAEESFKTHAEESVLVQSTTATVGEPPFRAAVADVVRAASAVPVMREVRSPFAPGNDGLVSADRHSALVQLKLTGDEEKAMDKVEPVLAAVAGCSSGTVTTRSRSSASRARTTSSTRRSARTSSARSSPRCR